MNFVLIIIGGDSLIFSALEIIRIVNVFCARPRSLSPSWFHLNASWPYLLSTFDLHKSEKSHTHTHNFKDSMERNENRSLFPKCVFVSVGRFDSIQAWTWTGNNTSRVLPTEYKRQKKREQRPDQHKHKELRVLIRNVCADCFYLFTARWRQFAIVVSGSVT